MPGVTDPKTTPKLRGQPAEDRRGSKRGRRRPRSAPSTPPVGAWPMRSTLEKTSLTALTDETFDELMVAPRAVVIVTEAGSANAARYLTAIGAVAARGDLDGVALPLLERSGVEGSRLVQAYPWLRGLRLVPYTLIFDRGRRVDAFAAVQADVLLARLARPVAPAAVAGAAGPVGRDADSDWWSVPLGAHRAAA